MGLLPSSILATAICMSPILLLWLGAFLVASARSGWKSALKIFGQTLWIPLGLSGLIFVIMLAFYKIPSNIRAALYIVILGILSIICFTIFILSVSSLFNHITAKPVVFDTADAKRGFVSIGKCKLRLEWLFFSIIWIFIGGLRLTGHNLDPKDYLYAAMQFSITVSDIAIAFNRFQIRENGILSSTGQLTKWQQIAHYSWANNRSEMVLTLDTTRRLSLFKTDKTHFRQEEYQTVREIIQQYMSKRDASAPIANLSVQSTMSSTI